MHTHTQCASKNPKVEPRMPQVHPQSLKHWSNSSSSGRVVLRGSLGCSGHFGSSAQALCLYLRAAAQCRRPLRWGPAQVFFVLSAAFGLLACLLARLLACLLVFSAFPGRTRLPTASANQRSAPAAERKRKETKGAGSRKGERKKKGRTGGPRQSFGAENCALQVLERCSRPHSFAPHSEHQQKECENRPNGLAVTELQR